jgi:hypothetical protein
MTVLASWGTKRAMQIQGQFSQQLDSIRHGWASGKINQEEKRFLMARLAANMNAAQEPDGWHRNESWRNGAYRRCNPLRRSECRCHLIG